MKTKTLFRLAAQSIQMNKIIGRDEQLICGSAVLAEEAA